MLDKHIHPPASKKSFVHPVPLKSLAILCNASEDSEETTLVAKVGFWVNVVDVAVRGVKIMKMVTPIADEMRKMHRAASASACTHNNRCRLRYNFEQSSWRFKFLIVKVTTYVEK